MVSISLNVNVEGDNPFQKMINGAKQLDGKKVDAGLFGGFAQKKAMWQEYGTSRGIPARPFLRNTLYEKGPQWPDFIAPQILDSILNGSGANITNLLGQKMVDDIRATIDAGNFAPLSPETIKRKGHAKPLIDTGEMYGAITFKDGGK